jgi:hypothetical protein
VGKGIPSLDSVALGAGRLPQRCNSRASNSRNIVATFGRRVILCCAREIFRDLHHIFLLHMKNLNKVNVRARAQLCGLPELLGKNCTALRRMR